MQYQTQRQRLKHANSGLVYLKEELSQDTFPQEINDKQQIQTQMSKDCFTEPEIVEG